MALTLIVDLDKLLPALLLRRPQNSGGYKLTPANVDIGFGPFNGRVGVKLRTQCQLRTPPQHLSFAGWCAKRNFEGQRNATPTGEQAPSATPLCSACPPLFEHLLCFG